jgi:4'-phosphopantetheinyl transferase
MTGPVDLHPDRVHVFFADHAAAAATPGRWEPALAPAERARAGAFAFPRERERFVASRGLLRELLGRLAGGDPCAAEILSDPGGKPRLAGSCGQGRIRFNVAHSGDLWACAVALHREVGIDVEAVDPSREVSRLAARYFSPAEADALAALPEGERGAAFHRIWTRKEAWLKARGFGLALALDSFEMSHAPGDARLLATRPDPAEAARWELHDLDIGPGHAAAVALETVVRNPTRDDGQAGPGPRAAIQICSFP